LNVRLIVVVACGLAGLVACRPAPRAPATDASTAPSSSGRSACDEYYQKMTRCLASDRWPAQTRREATATIARLRESDRAATIPEAREMREDGCRTSIRIMQMGNQGICPGVW
jgi:hypothetical protein